MFEGLGYLKGKSISLSGSDCTIVRVYKKGAKPYIETECRMSDEKTGERKIKKEDIIIDARLLERLKTENDKSQDGRLEDSKCREIINEIAKEYIICCLKTAYMNAYDIVTGNKDANLIYPAFSGDDDKANLQFTLALAFDGMPEAIFELCDNHKSFADPLKQVFDPGQLALFGYKSENYIGCSFTRIYSAINPNVRNRMQEQREVLFCGTEDGCYGDSGITWKNVSERILPIATADIWDSLYSFYNAPDALVDPGDVMRFNELYNERYAFCTLDESETNEKAIKRIKSLSDIESDVLEQIASSDYNSIADRLSRGSENDKCFTAYIVAVRPLQPGTATSSEWDRIYQKSQRIIAELSEKRAGKLMNELTFNEQMGIVDFLHTKVGLPISEQWEKVLKDCFEKSLSSGNSRWWIGALDSFNLLLEYSENTEFWSSIKPSGLMMIINQFYEALTPERFLAFAERICKYYNKRGIGDSEICSCWKKYIIQAVLVLSPESGTSARIFSSTLLGVFSEEELPAMLEKLFLGMSQINNNVRRVETGDSKENLAEKLVGQMEKFSDLEEAISTGRGNRTEADAFTTKLLRKVFEIKNDLSYLSEHEWNLDIKPVVDETEFLNFQEIPFDRTKHVASLDVEDNVPVKAISSGLKLGNVVKKKATVLVSKGGSI